MTKAGVRYTVAAKSPAAHLFEVVCEIPHPDPQGEHLSLPAWIPGSYMIREFAKNIVTLEASCGDKPVKLVKQDKHSWRTGPMPRAAATREAMAPLRVTAQIYAWDLSVRCAHLDQTHAFFNGTQMFLCVAGREHAPHEVMLLRPAGEGYRAWRVATTLARARQPGGQADRAGFGLYRASDYDALIDHPVEMGAFLSLGFKAAGVNHSIALTGRFQLNARRLQNDLQKICEWHIGLFRDTAPFKRYLFQVMVVGDGYGGLEHRDSTALICSRNDLPAPGDNKGMSEAYRGFLGLCSHEYFHAWNIKRIKPERFLPYDLRSENYTSLLWVFEGFTSYYDDLALVRTGIIATQDYLSILAKTINAVMRGNGRHKQSVAESSFDAWIKYYRQDENSPNAIVSYYTKGSLIALAIDLSIRLETRGKYSLDDVMRYLWQQHGKPGIGIAEDAMPGIVRAATGVDLRAQLAQWVDGTRDLPLQKLLERFGVQWTQTAKQVPDKLFALGIKAKGGSGNELVVAQVFEGSSAERAGIAAGDTLIALDGLRIGINGFAELLGRYASGEHLDLVLFRRDELMHLTLQVPALSENVCVLSVMAKATAAKRSLLKAWVGTA